MTIITRFSLTIVLTLACTLVCVAQVQTPAVEMTTDAERAQFSAQGETKELRVEIYSPSGEKVFEGAAQAGESLVWSMTDQKGRRVVDGLYLASVTLVDATGKARKRVEQISVSRVAQQRQAPGVNAPPPEQAIGPISGEGTGAPTSGRIARFTDTHEIGDSIVVESANRLIINPLGAAPNAVLQVNGLQPAASAASGTTATALLTTTGGKGGDTTGSGKVGGKGASISLVAGNGGNAPAGSTNGSGGSITLQPGSPGTGGASGAAGNVLLAPTVGRVGIGTNTPAFKLHVEAVSGIGVFVNNPSSGTGVFGFSSSGIGVSGISGSGYAGFFSGKSKFSGNVEITGKVGIGTAAPQFKLHVEAGSTSAVKGVSTSVGVLGESTSSHGVSGVSTSGNGVKGFSVSGTGVMGSSPDGLAGHFIGNVTVTGNICAGNVPCPSDARLKQGIKGLNYGLHQVLRLRPVSWHWKTEPEGKLQMGLVAQEVERVMPELILRGTDATKPLGLNYMALLPVAVKAIQEQQEQIKQLQELVTRQQAQLLRQQAQLNRVKRTIKSRRATTK